MDFLLKRELYEVKINIFENKDLNFVYMDKKGYALYISDNNQRKDTFLIKTSLSPKEFVLEENKKEKVDFIDLIQLFLSKIYDGSEIPDFEKEHQEFVFLKFIDLFDKGEYTLIDESQELFKLLDNGFMKLDISDLLLKNR